MKKIISILTILILIVTLSACIKIYIPSQDTDTDTSIPSDENSEITDNLETPLSVTHKTQEMDIYPSYDLGSCYVSEIKKAYINYGNVSYYIFKTYDEANQYTDNGKNLNESIFENNYILVVKFGYTRDKAGLIGFKNLRTGTALNLITVVNDGSGKDTNNEYYYLEIPKENFNGWENFGEIGIRKETIDYANIKEEYPPSDFIMEEDGEILLLSRQELRDFIKDNNLSIIVESLQITDNYIVCYSKKQFGTRLFFTTPTVNGNTVTLYRDYTLSKYKNERAFLHIIPIEAENTVEINKIELTSRVINLDEFYSQGTQIDNTVTTYKNVDFYKTFRGGLYYGTELANRSESSYTVIESYREMLTKTEFCIDEEIFNDNYVLVLKLVGNYEYRLGFANAKASKSETTSIINIDLYLTPYCDEILNDGSEDLKEKVDVIEPTVKTYYEYIVVPKTHLKNVTKTGNLEINVNGTFNNYEEPTVYSYNYNKEMYNIVPGNTWIISSKSEQTQFNQDFGTTFSLNLGKEYGREYVIIYLNEYLNYEILQKAIRETDTLYYLSLLVKPKDTQNTVNKGCFVAFPIDSSSVNKKVIVEFTKINYGEYDSQSVETEIAVYDHYTINLKYNNNPEWTYKVLTDYTKFEEVYNTYKYDPEETLTADAIFSNSIFDTHYVVAFLSYYYDDVYYNARISGDKYLYIYAFNDRDMIEDLNSYNLTFISIPKNDITTEISGVKIQYTNQVAYNGPFENVIITSNNQEDVKLENSFVIVNSDEELQNILPTYENYPTLQNVDFENNIIIAFNRRAYTTSEYLYGDFVNFKTTIHGTTSITFMSEEGRWLPDLVKTYVLDLVIIPKEYIKHEIKYFYVNYAKYGELFDSDDIDRLIPEDTFYD